MTMQARAERHVERIAGITHRVLPHLESMEPAKILDNARNLEQLDRVARRNFGLDNQPAGGGVVNLDILCNQSLIQVVNKPA